MFKPRQRASSAIVCPNLNISQKQTIERLKTQIYHFFQCGTPMFGRIDELKSQRRGRSYLCCSRQALPCIVHMQRSLYPVILTILNILGTLFHAKRYAVTRYRRSCWHWEGIIYLKMNFLAVETEANKRKFLDSDITFEECQDYYFNCSLINALVNKTTTFNLAS
jgi:hypothetical protein